MFNFKTRKELKEEVASLEKQLGYAEEIATDERKENLKLRNERDVLTKDVEILEEKLTAKFEEANKQKDEIEKLQRFLGYEQRISDGRFNRIQRLKGEVEKLGIDLKVAKHDLRQLEAISLKRLEDRNYWRDKNSKQWAERTRTAKHLEIARKQLRREQELREQDQQKLREEKLKIKMDLKEKEETIYNFCLMENKVSDRLGFELRKTNEENRMLRNENEENKKLIKELEIKNNKGAEWLLSKEEERKLREELSNLRSQLEEKEEEVTRLAIDSDKVKVKQEKELTKATEENIQLAIEKQETLDEMEKLLQDNKRKRNYASGLGKINKVVKIVRHKK